MQISKQSFLVCLVTGFAWGQCTDSGWSRLSLSATIGTGRSLEADGQGTYLDGVDNAEVYALDAGDLWTTAHLPVKRKPRSLTFHLTSPVIPAPWLGVINDPRGELHAFYKLDPPAAGGLPIIRSFQEIPADGVPVRSERTELWLYLNGAPHILMFGGTTWPKNTCTPQNGALLSAPGTTNAWVTRTLNTWTVYSEPSGSIGRLIDYTDPFHPVDKGLYNFSFYFTFEKKAKGK